MSLKSNVLAICATAAISGVSFVAFAARAEAHTAAISCSVSSDSLWGSNYNTDLPALYTFNNGQAFKVPVGGHTIPFTGATSYNVRWPDGVSQPEQQIPTGCLTPPTTITSTTVPTHECPGPTDASPPLAVPVGEECPVTTTIVPPNTMPPTTSCDDQFCTGVTTPPTTDKPIWTTTPPISLATPTVLDTTTVQGTIAPPTTCVTDASHNCAPIALPPTGNGPVAPPVTAGVALLIFGGGLVALTRNRAKRNNKAVSQ